MSTAKKGSTSMGSFKKAGSSTSQHSTRRADAWVAKGRRVQGSAQGPGSEESNDRLHLYEYNKPNIARIVAEYAAKGGNLRDSIIILADVDDPEGAEIAAVLAPDDADGDSIRERGEIPTMTAIVGRSIAEKGFSGSHPAFSEKLRGEAPEGYAWLAVVASGGATLLAIAVPEPVTAGPTGTNR